MVITASPERSETRLRTSTASHASTNRRITCASTAPPGDACARTRPPSARSRSSPSRARWSALLTAGTVSSSASATSRADQPRASRSTSTARCLGGSVCIAATSARPIASRSSAITSGPASLAGISSSSTSGYGCRKRSIPARSRARRSAAVRQTFVAMRYSHDRSGALGSKRGSPRHARSIASCKASSASSREPSIR